MHVLDTNIAHIDLLTVEDLRYSLTKSITLEIPIKGDFDVHGTFSGCSLEIDTFDRHRLGSRISISSPCSLSNSIRAPKRAETIPHSNTSRDNKQSHNESSPRHCPIFLFHFLLVDVGSLRFRHASRRPRVTQLVEIRTSSDPIKRKIEGLLYKHCCSDTSPSFQRRMNFEFQN